MKKTSASAAFWLCCGGTMCLAIASNLPPVFLTTFSEAFGGRAGLTEEQLGRIPAAVFVGFVIGIAFTSPLADRCGAKRFAVLGLVLLAAGLGLLGLARTYAVLLAAVFLLGAGAGTLEVVLSPIVAALHPERRTAVLSWLHSSYCAAAVGVVLIGSAALHFQVSWRPVAFGIVAMPAAVLLGFLSVGSLPLVHEEAQGDPPHVLLRRPFFLATLTLICLGGATEIGVAQWLPAYAERSLGYTKATGGMALAAFSVAMLVGRIVIGFLVHRIKATSLMLGCCAGSTVLILAAAFLPYPAVALLACVLLGFTVCCFWPASLGLASDRFPRGGAFMFGTLAAFGNAGCTVMPWVIGLVAEKARLDYALATVALCPLVMALVLKVLVHPHRAPTHEEAIAGIADQA